MRPIHAALVALAILLAAPPALAAGTLADLEAPHRGRDTTWMVTVLPEEAAKPQMVIFRNEVTSPFRLVVYGPGGLVEYTMNGSRGLDPLPPLSAGPYRFEVQGNGSFQVTSSVFDGENLTGHDGPLTGTADAFVIARKAYEARFEGDVEVEWWNLFQEPEILDPPAQRTSEPRGAYVITVRGAEGTSYSIELDEQALPTPTSQEQTPFLGLAPLVGLAALLALRRRR